MSDAHAGPGEPLARHEARRRLIDRLESIGTALAARGDALALLALGSLAQGQDRIDEYSDLDFFVLVRDGAKSHYIEDLSWLASAHAIAWQFRNTVDGCKVLLCDGILCEFAVFELHELAAIPYAPGRFVWRRDEVAPSLAQPVRALPPQPDAAWLAGEALSNLLVGLNRHARGERLAAMRLVQVHALDHLLRLREHGAKADDRVPRDAFAVERRIEQRQPDFAEALCTLAGGYQATPQAALALLLELEALHPVCPALAAKIRSLTAVADRITQGT